MGRGVALWTCGALWWISAIQSWISSNGVDEVWLCKCGSCGSVSVSDFQNKTEVN